MRIDRKLSLLYTWAHLKHDEDITHNDHKVALNELRAMFFEFQQQISWFDPELIALPEETQAQYLKDPTLKEYAFHLEKTFRLKKHTLPPSKKS